jgi:hypothetical protein
MFTSANRFEGNLVNPTGELSEKTSSSNFWLPMKSSHHLIACKSVLQVSAVENFVDEQQRKSALGSEAEEVSKTWRFG